MDCNGSLVVWSVLCITVTFCLAVPVGGYCYSFLFSVRPLGLLPLYHSVNVSTTGAGRLGDTT